MTYRLAADALMLLHLGFVLFALLGGLLTVRWRWTLPVHLLALGWAVYVELADRGCPLTLWEQALRLQAGDAGYSEGFIEHYLLPILYPAWLTLPVEVVLAAVVLLSNLLVYAWVYRRRRRMRLKPLPADRTAAPLTPSDEQAGTSSTPAPEPCWLLYRIDDNGNELPMCRFSDPLVAEKTLHEYEQRGHKQAYLLREER